MPSGLPRALGDRGAETGPGWHIYALADIGIVEELLAWRAPAGVLKSESSVEIPESARRLDGTLEIVEAELLVADPRCWLGSTVGQRAGVRILAQQPIHGASARDLVELSFSQVGGADLIRSIRAFPWVRSVHLQASSKGRLLGIIESVSCVACKIARESDCFLMASHVDSGRLRWRVVSQGTRPIRELVSILTNSGCDVSLDALRKPSAEMRASVRQREVIIAAIEAGYFETPRGITLEELGRRLGVSKAAASETMRRGLKKILGLAIRG